MSFIIIQNEPIENLVVFENVIRQQNQLGTPILGMGEGAKLLLEWGLVPGIEDEIPVVHLTSGDPHSHIRLSPEYQRNAFTGQLTLDMILPIAPTHYHFDIPPALLWELQMQGLDVFHFCDEWGNGASHIAAISNKRGNVMAMIPIMQSDLILQSVKNYVKEGYVPNDLPLNYYPRRR